MQKNLVTVKNRVKRILTKTVKGFRLIEECENHQLPDQFSLQNNENIIGLYTNKHSDKCRHLFISNLGIYTPDTYIPYHTMVDVEAEIKEPKHETDTLLVITKNQTHKLLLSADQGRFSDVFEFSRFLRRVIEDIEKHRY